MDTQNIDPNFSDSHDNDLNELELKKTLPYARAIIPKSYLWFHALLLFINLITMILLVVLTVYIVSFFASVKTAQVGAGAVAA